MKQRVEITVKGVTIVGELSKIDNTIVSIIMREMSSELLQFFWDSEIHCSDLSTEQTPYWHIIIFRKEVEQIKFI